MEFLSAVILLSLVTDPFGNVPLVNAMLAGVPESRRRLVILRECAIAFALLMAFMFGGRKFLVCTDEEVSDRLAPTPNSFMWLVDVTDETNPVPVKAALAMLGVCEEEYRLPLVPMSPKNREVLRATLKACGVLK